MEACDLLTAALNDLCWSAPASGDLDIAEANLVCAVGLPGAERLNVDSHLARLDEIAADVRRVIFLKANYDQFLNNPGKFHNSQAYFCVVCMVSVLKTKYRLGYSARWKHVSPETEAPDDFGRDARDQFIHAILDGEGGTCGSLPVFIVAIGRRIGMPLKLVKAYRHLFIRWDDRKGTWNPPEGVPNPSQGEVFNIEATGPDVHRLSDAEYRYRWPRAIPTEYLTAGIYLKSLTTEQEPAEFLAARVYCLIRNGRIADGIAAMRWSCRLAPHNSLRTAELDQLTAYLQLIRRGPYLNQPLEMFHEPAQSAGPHWVQTNCGSRLLVQILKPDYLTPMTTFGMHSAMNVGLALQHRSVQLPNGHSAWAEVPVHGSGQEMEAFWIEFSSNEFALVHKPVFGAYPLPDIHLIGQPILPETEQPSWRTPSPTPYRGGVAVLHAKRQSLSLWEENSIKLAIQAAKDESAAASRSQWVLPAQFLPVVGFAPTHAHLSRTPGQSTGLPHLLT